jgi:hypothetical protein
MAAGMGGLVGQDGGRREAAGCKGCPMGVQRLQGQAVFAGGGRVLERPCRAGVLQPLSQQPL